MTLLSIRSFAKGNSVLLPSLYVDIEVQLMRFVHRVRVPVHRDSSSILDTLVRRCAWLLLSR